MRRILTLSLPLFALLSGCAGIDLNTLAPEQVTSARNGTGPALNGYVLYDPVVVVEISSKEVCLGEKDKDGNCAGQTVTQCAASVPFLLPDYSKPYLVASRSGFGKAGVDITISDGWRLGGIKDNSDNTAILSAIGYTTDRRVRALSNATPRLASVRARTAGLPGEAHSVLARCPPVPAAHRLCRQPLVDGHPGGHCAGVSATGAAGDA